MLRGSHGCSYLIPGEPEKTFSVLLLSGDLGLSHFIADSTVEVYPPDLLRAGMRDREACTPGQIGFWQFAHGEDWEQPVDADSDMLRRIADRGGRLAPEALETIQCPVLDHVDPAQTNSVHVDRNLQVTPRARRSPGPQPHRTQSSHRVIDTQISR